MSSAAPELIVEAGRTRRGYWRELWRYRELFYFLIWRDLKVRYKQTLIGVAWVLLRPFLLMLVLTLVFQRVAKLPADGGTPYAIMVLAALLPWQFFTTALSDAANSMVGNAQIVTKIYFPRILLPLSTLGVGLVDFVITILLLFLLMLWYGSYPTMYLFLLPLFLVLGMIVTLGAGLWSAALHVRYRDVRFIIPFIIQFGLYLSPVGYSSEIIPEQWRLLYSLNPMVGVIDGFRWSILGGQSALYLPSVVSSLLIGLLLFGSGLRYFRQTEKRFADVI